MVNGVPREVPRPKPKEPQAPRVSGRGTSRGTPFTMIPPRLLSSSFCPVHEQGMQLFYWEHLFSWILMFGTVPVGNRVKIRRVTTIYKVSHQEV